jgi:hypothetical protein
MRLGSVIVIQNTLHMGVCTFLTKEKGIASPAKQSVPLLFFFLLDGEE